MADRSGRGIFALERLIAAGLAAETVGLVIAGGIFLRRQGYTLAEAGAGAILLVFMAFSLIHQIDIWVGSSWPGVVAELVFLVAVLVAGMRQWPPWGDLPRSASNLIRQAMFPGLSIAAAWGFMAILIGIRWGAAATLPSGAILSGGPHAGLALLTANHPVPPLNAAALFYHAGRFGLPPGACGFGLLAHMAVGFSTYALARRYAWPPMAITITLMVLSMPRLVLLAIFPCAELMSAAAVAVSVLLLYRLVEQHRVWDLRFFLLCLLFSIQAHPMSAALVLVMALLLTLVMIRRHGWLLWRELIVAWPKSTILILLPAVMLAQVPAFSHNLVHAHPLFGAPIGFDTGGIIGALANLVRYLFISLDPTEAVRTALVWLVGIDLKQVMMGFYQSLVVSLFGRSGVNVPFAPVFSGGVGVGFGPFAALLVLPAMAYAALSGPRRIKALSVAWAGYLYLAALVIAWTTDSIAVLTPLYAANGFMVAFALPPWRLRRRGMRLLQVLFVLLLAGALSLGWWWLPLRS